MAKKWTKEEIEYLKSNYSQKTNKELANEMGLLYSQIRSKSSNLKLKKSEDFLKNIRREILLKINLNNNPMSNPISIEKNRQKQTENYKSGKVKCWADGLTKETDKRLKKFSEDYKGRYVGEEWRNNIKKTHWSKSQKKDETIKNFLKTRKPYQYSINKKIKESVEKSWEDPNSIFNSKEYRKKLSLATSMENNPMWKNGVSFEPYGIDFNTKMKNLIRKRDNQLCMNCGIHREKINRSFDCHHINYDKNCNILQNLICLCNKCHSMTNTNREYWTKLFQEKLSKIYNYKYDENGNIILEVNNEK